VLTGSLARGDGTVIYPGPRPVVLSDIDMAVIYTGDAARDRAAPVLAKLGRETARDFTRWGLLAAIDLGCYARSDLRRQAARPGTLEFRHCGRVIYGNEGVLSQLPEYTADQVSADEVLLLCENRLLELLWAHEALDRGGSALYAALYAGGKAVLDGALAWLVSRGRFPLTVEERLLELEAMPAEDRAGLDESYLDALRFWTRFKNAPQVPDLSGRYGGSLEPPVLAREAWREGAGQLLGVYRSLIEEPGPRAAGEESAWKSAARRAPLRRRIRRWAEAWRERGPRHLDWAGFGGVIAHAAQGTPEHLLGASAAALVATAPEMNGHGAEDPGRIARVARNLSPVPWSRDASWEERRKHLVRAWDCWVLRGTRTGEGDAPWNARSFS
jgi:hypothetical protein